MSEPDVFERVHVKTPPPAGLLCRREEGETEIDLVQFQATAHQPIHWQLAAPIKLDVAGYIANRYAGADVTALHGPLLGDKVDLRQRKGVVGRRQDCRHCGAAPVGDPVCKVQGAYGTGHFEGEFDSATGRGSDLLDLSLIHISEPTR